MSTKGICIRRPEVETSSTMPPVMADVATMIEAFNHCKRGSIWKASVQFFERDLLRNCLSLVRDVQNGTYKPEPYYEFTICERGKVRHIKAPSIRDRVLCHALCHNVLLPRILPHLIYDNSASVKGKGISFARKRILAHLHKYYAKYGTNTGYILQTDFSSFFDSIPHDRLFECFKQYVPEPDILRLIRTILDSYTPTGTGLGIGSELSQVAGIMYPHPVDTYCKTVRQCKYYARYMDDIYVIHPDKAFLHDVYKGMQAEADKLGLRFNPKKCHIARIDKGFTFLKGIYKLTPSGRVSYSPHRKTLTRERRRLRRMPKDALPDAYRAWHGNMLKQFPHMPFLTMRNFDNLYGGIQL